MAMKRGRKPAEKANAPPSCPGCAARLDLFQPSLSEPDRILGVCLNPDCRTWVLFERDAETGAWRIRTRLQAPAERITRRRRHGLIPARGDVAPGRPRSPGRRALLSMPQRNATTARRMASMSPAWCASATAMKALGRLDQLGSR